MTLPRDGHWPNFAKPASYIKNNNVGVLDNWIPSPRRFQNTVLKGYPVTVDVKEISRTYGIQTYRTARTNGGGFNIVTGKYPPKQLQQALYRRDLVHALQEDVIRFCHKYRNAKELFENYTLDDRHGSKYSWLIQHMHNTGQIPKESKIFGAANPIVARGVDEGLVYIALIPEYMSLWEACNFGITDPWPDYMPTSGPLLDGRPHRSLKVVSKHLRNASIIFGVPVYQGLSGGTYNEKGERKSNLRPYLYRRELVHLYATGFFHEEKDDIESPLNAFDTMQEKGYITDKLRKQVQHHRTFLYSPRTLENIAYDEGLYRIYPWLMPERFEIGLWAYADLLIERARMRIKNEGGHGLSREEIFDLQRMRPSSCQELGIPTEIASDGWFHEPKEMKDYD